jgi:hypothetical protein
VPTNKNLFPNTLMNFIKVLFAVATLAVATTQAATLTFEVQVKGYSGAGWIGVRPELRGVLGGKVAYLPQYGGWVTDRVARGESVRISILPRTAQEGRCKVAALGVNSNSTFAGLAILPLPAVATWQVSQDPSFDSVRMAVNTAFETTEHRVPIGTR